MSNEIIHRGPDGVGYWTDPAQGVYLGHRRLAILDLAGGQQPMWTADGALGVVFNGEIYNYRELRTELEQAGHVFLTDHSDTEVLLHGYREWGEALTGRLNGMWAFALYDRRQARLFCSRDRFGKKPFYYTLQQGSFVFASELTALLCHPSVTATVSRPAIRKYIAYGYLPAPNTPYHAIHKLPAGCSLVFALDSGSLHLSRYWSFVLEPAEARPAGIEKQWQEELLEKLDKAVACRLVADVPLGVFLSGGIDSSAVAALAARHSGAGQLQTFNIGFDVAGFDESAHARRVAALLNTRHHEAILSLDVARSLLPAITGKLDEPMADSSLLPTSLLCQHARRHVTVALGGDGADELFAGYAPFRALRWASYYQKLVPGPLHTAIRLLANRLPVGDGYMSLDFKLKRTLQGLSHPPRLWHPSWMCPLDDAALAECLMEPVDPEELFSEAIAAWERCSQPDLVDRSLQFFTDIYLQDDILAKVDRASMMHSLEVRSPFLDINVVDLARKIPSEYKLRHGETKYILKKALARILPQDILQRPKQGFAVPIAKWLRDDALQLDESSALAGLNDAFIAKTVADYRQHNSNRHHFLWGQWTLAQVMQRHAALVNTPSTAETVHAL
ncbi:asparagine synthase (glutamine-hydrolyzing) [Vogesella indigofera]|uniref:asparagine synthase (glutamine-hydrolyzing) n=1 Tax=Vogesella indigofera TaxID=45465 RepID=UPI00234E9478|nr:asparagine synthase (glutamine-hydrolyzing) [Vogesella indigofera]MDC7712187.1 asparagine synthase (glutamine-hydrolyzing) [Vogesella indigofera]